MEQHMQYVLDYLVENYPIKRKKKRNPFTKRSLIVYLVPISKIRMGDLLSGDFASYSPDTDQITLNEDVIKTPEELTAALAHEYMHYKQYHEGRFKLYNWYLVRKRTGYWDNPLEKEARRFEEKIREELHPAAVDRDTLRNQAAEPEDPEFQEFLNLFKD